VGDDLVPDTLETPVLKKVRHKLATMLEKYSSTIPGWAKDYLEVAVGNGFFDSARHPKTKKGFKIPGFRCLWKVHKARPDTRPIAGNFCWLLQPHSDVIDHMLAPLVKDTPNWIRDSDHAINKLDSISVQKDELLVSFDWVNLYPSIAHGILGLLRAVGVESPRLAQRNGLALAAAVHRVRDLALAVKDRGGGIGDAARDHSEGSALRQRGGGHGQWQEVVRPAQHQHRHHRRSLNCVATRNIVFSRRAGGSEL
jgi:hypothetical protein